MFKADAKYFEKMLKHLFTAFPYSVREKQKVELDKLPIWQSMTDEEKQKVSRAVHSQGYTISIKDGVAFCSEKPVGTFGISFAKAKGALRVTPFKAFIMERIGLKGIDAKAIKNCIYGETIFAWKNLKDYNQTRNQYNRKVSSVALCLTPDGDVKKLYLPQFCIEDPRRFYADSKGDFREMGSMSKEPTDREAYSCSEIVQTPNMIFQLECVHEGEIGMDCSRAYVERIRKKELPFADDILKDAEAAMQKESLETHFTERWIKYSIEKTPPLAEIVDTKMSVCLFVEKVVGYIQSLIDDNKEELIDYVYNKIREYSRWAIHCPDDNSSVDKKIRRLEKCHLLNEKPLEPFIFLNHSAVTLAIHADWCGSAYTRSDGSLRLKWPFQANGKRVSDLFAEYLVFKAAASETPIDLYHGGPSLSEV